MTLFTAKRNLLLLPDQCYGKLPLDNSIIIIFAGDMGYTTIKQQPELNGQDVDEFINERNARENVTIAQRMAMEHGSMFGWGTGGANITMYNEDGSLNR